MKNEKKISLRNSVRVYGILFLSFGFLNAIFLGFLIRKPNLILAFLSGITLFLSLHFNKLYKKKDRELQEIMRNIRETIDYIDGVVYFDSNYNNEGCE